MELLKYRAQECPRIALIDENIISQNILKKRIQSQLEVVDLLNFRNSREAIYNLWECHLSNPPKIDFIFIGYLKENKKNSMEILEYCSYLPENIPTIFMSNKILNVNALNSSFPEYIWKVCS